MFIFGHIGITVGAATIISGLATKSRPDQNKKETELENHQKRKSLLASWFESLANFMDVRLLIIGSMLPDIIDKPLGIILQNSGRTYTHTLLITLIACGLGLYLYKKHRSSWLLTLNIGMFSHLILDQMWQSPDTLFWPLVGWTFPRENPASWLSNWLSTLIHNPAVYISEIAGLLILMSILWFLIGKHKLWNFFLKGKV